MTYSTGDGLERYPPCEPDQEAAAGAGRKRVVHSSRLGIPDETRADKDKRRKPCSIAERMENAVKLYMNILAGGIEIREVGKHADLFVDVEGPQPVPAVRTGPMGGGALRQLVDVPAGHRTPRLGEARPGQQYSSQPQAPAVFLYGRYD